MDFLGDDFLLETPQARRLFHGYCENEPIFDFHCHISPEQLRQNRPFADISELWLGGDHYKWRAMRVNGVDEETITGKCDSFTRFLAWAGTIEHAAGNPLYHWTHLELKRYFGIDVPLNTFTAREIYEECNKQLKESRFLPLNIVAGSNVRAVCTTDDPCDELDAHAALAGENIGFKVLPTFRPDKACGIGKPGFAEYIRRLSAVSSVNINSFTSLCEALERRCAYFSGLGCLSSDFSFETPVFPPPDAAKADAALRAALEGSGVTEEESLVFKSTLLTFLGECYARSGFAMQLHIGALRNVNGAMFDALGPDSGFDIVDDSAYIRPVAAFLDTLRRRGSLPKTVIYNLNGKDSQAFAALAAAFCGEGVVGKVQYGAAWWFLDTLEGNISQLKTLAGLHLLSRFIGMLTDSRSLLSFVRHEYFRRILCSIFGDWAARGLIPDDEKTNGGIVRDISFGNAVRFFGLY